MPVSSISIAVSGSNSAQAAFELVVSSYPDSTMAMLAQQALDRLRQP